MHASKFLSDDYQLKIEPVDANRKNMPNRQKFRSKSRENLSRPVSSPRKLNCGSQIPHEPAMKVSKGSKSPKMSGWPRNESDIARLFELDTMKRYSVQ